MNVEQRVLKLERQNRRLRLTLSVLCAVGVGALVMGQTTKPTVPDVIRAKRFEAVDDKGRSLAVIEALTHGGIIETRGPGGLEPMFLVSANTEGDCVVVTHNGDGKQLVELTSTGSGGALVTCTPEGKALVVLGALKGGGGAITTYAGDGKELVELGGMEGNADGSVAVYSSNGRPVCTMTVDEDGRGRISASDGDGSTRVLTPEL